jgi:hypothetical protein
MPKEVYSQIESSLKATLDKPRYARVFMAPSALLEHDFFNTYIKSGMYASSSVLEAQGLSLILLSRKLQLPELKRGLNLSYISGVMF